MLLLLSMILLIAPIIILVLYSITFKDALQIFSIVGLFNVLLPVLTQSFHVFTIPVVLSFHIIFISVLFLYVYKYRHISISVLKNRISNYIFPLFLVSSIIFIQIYSIHNNYNGEVQTVRGPKNLENITYKYPFFSDEWVTVSLIKYSIDNNELPLVNPLDHNKNFINPLFVFSSFNAGLFLITGLDPLVNYYFLSILITIICAWVIYFILISCNVNKWISLASVLGLSYITNSGNMPAFWVYLPVSLSLVFFLLTLLSKIKGSDKGLYVYSFLSLLIYPPIVVFIVPVLVLNIYDKFRNNNFLLIKSGLFTIFLFIGIILLSAFFTSPESGLSIIHLFKIYLVRPNLDPGIPSFNLWNVLPIIFLPFYITGIFISIRKKFFILLYPLIVGAIFWVFYTYINKVFIIEYNRVIFVEAVLLIVFSGIGFGYILDWVINEIKYFKSNASKVYLITSLIIISLVASIIPWYGTYNLWKDMKLNLINKDGRIVKVSPAPFINTYLLSEDLDLFKNIDGQNFITYPWKGLVIGVATGNFPIESKSSTISNNKYKYGDFMKLKCQDKYLIANKFGIKYVYSDPIDCPSFEKISSSSERLILYKFIKDPTVLSKDK